MPADLRHALRALARARGFAAVTDPSGTLPLSAVAVLAAVALGASHVAALRAD